MVTEGAVLRELEKAPGSAGALAQRMQLGSSEVGRVLVRLEGKGKVKAHIAGIVKVWEAVR